MGSIAGRIEKLKTILKFSFLILIGTMVLIVFGLTQGSAIAFITYPYFLGSCAVLALITIVKNFRNKKWILGILQLVGLPFVFLIFYVLFYPRDLFFSNQQIPENTDFELPINLNSKLSIDSLMALSNSNFEIQLANYGQPGMYKSFIWTNLNEEGKLYLRAYDAIHNFELERITKRTELKVNKSESPISQEFTVYDGVWGSYYLARFEVWFKPTDGSVEQKIGEQTFKVEGWIR